MGNLVSLVFKSIVMRNVVDFVTFWFHVLMVIILRAWFTLIWISNYHIYVKVHCNLLSKLYCFLVHEFHIVCAYSPSTINVNLQLFQGLLYAGNDTIFESTGLYGQVGLLSLWIHSIRISEQHDVFVFLAFTYSLVYSLLNLLDVLFQSSVRRVALHSGEVHVSSIQILLIPWRILTCFLFAIHCFDASN